MRLPNRLQEPSLFTFRSGLPSCALRWQELIDENVLQPDVLMVADSEYGEMGAEHYPYDD